MASGQSSSSSSLGLGGYPYLPYPQAACREIEHHLLSLAAAFPRRFEATLSPFTHDDGRDAVLVRAAGALPATGAEVSLWLLEAYPHVPPLVFATPPPPPAGDSAARRPAYIDSSSAVSAAPYLRRWRWPDSDLVGLVQSLDVLVRLHDDDQPPPPPVPSGQIHGAVVITEVATGDTAACARANDDVRRLDAAADTACVAVTTVADDRSSRDEDRRLEQQELQMAEAERMLHAVGLHARRSTSMEDEAAEDEMDALDAERQAGRVPLCRYLKGIKDIARAQFLSWPVPADLLPRPPEESYVRPTELCPRRFGRWWDIWTWL